MASTVVSQTSGMVQIVPFLFLGSKKAARNIDALQQNGITRVVNATLPKAEGGVYNYFADHENFEYLRIPVQDTDGQNMAGHFDATFAFIDNAIKSEHSVLLHCQQGVSRSATLCIAYLMRSEGIELTEAYLRVKTKKPDVKPNAHFLRQLIAYGKKLSDLRQMLDHKQQAAATLTATSGDVGSDDGDHDDTKTAVIRKRKMYSVPSRPEINGDTDAHRDADKDADSNDNSTDATDTSKRRKVVIGPSLIGPSRPEPCTLASSNINNSKPNPETV
jgi:atypical dual specificity phosphatase